MIADRYEDLPSQMSAFLATVKLILEMYRGRAILCEQFCKLNDC